MKPEMDKWLRLVVEKNASDLHVGANSPPIIRIDEKLERITSENLSEEAAKELTYSLLKPDQIRKFEIEKELDFSFEIENVGRFRSNVFRQRGQVGVSIRWIPFDIMTFQECHLPVVSVEALCGKPKGLVLVTGATGSGKSTTLASMVDYLNQKKACHIVTIEDPIEFVHKNKKALVDQREVYQDTHSFPSALKHVLRQDPDVVLIGEMRDLETVETALMCAETGHLVFATLHTSDSARR